MVFKKKEELGYIDPNINVQGQFKKPKELNNRELRDRERLSILRKLKPHLSDAIRVATKIMTNESSLDKDKLKASAMIISIYKDTLAELYDKEDTNLENSLAYIDEKKPKFSLDIEDIEVKHNV